MEDATEAQPQLRHNRHGNRHKKHFPGTGVWNRSSTGVWNSIPSQTVTGPKTGKTITNPGNPHNCGKSEDFQPERRDGCDGRSSSRRRYSL